MNLSSIAVKVAATSLLLVSTTGLAFAKHHKPVTQVESYKGENYKAEPIPCPPPRMLMSGFYLGAGVGYDSYRTRIYTSSFVSTPDEIFGLATSHSNAANGWVGSLFVGYGQYFNDLYYLGGEVFGSYSGAQGSQSATIQEVDVVAQTNDFLRLHSRFDANWGWGVALLPGLKLADTLLAYVRLGYNWVDLDGKGNGNFNGIPVFSRSGDQTAGGFNYGVGMESLVCENWSLRGEFTHTDYNSFSTGRRVVFAADGLLAFGGRSSFDPSDNQFMLSAIYHIA